MRFSIANWSALKIEFHFEFHAYFSPCELDKVQCLNFANFVTNSRVLSKSDVITYTIILHKLYAINCSKIAKLFTLILNELQPIEAHTFWFWRWNERLHSFWGFIIVHWVQQPLSNMCLTNYLKTFQNWYGM